MNSLNSDNITYSKSPSGDLGVKTIILLLLPVLMIGCTGKQQQAISPQAAEAEVAAAVDQLMKGITCANDSLLKSITADELVYGHSSGKVQNKSEFIAEIVSGQPLKYLSIELLNQTIQIAGDAAVVRHIFTAETLNASGAPDSLRIGNMLIWQLQGGKYKLLARQAYKL